MVIYGHECTVHYTFSILGLKYTITLILHDYMLARVYSKSYVQYA
jgi:hypothetical protein